MVLARTDTRFLRDMVDTLRIIDNLCNALNSVGTDQLLVIGMGPGGAITVTATDLDIRDLTKAQDELYAVLRTDAGAPYDGRDRSWSLGALDIPDLSDRAARLLGVIYGSQAAPIQQRAATLEVLVQLAAAGAEYDGRDRSWSLGALDIPDLSDRAARLLGIVYGSQGAQIQQRAITLEVLVQLASAGAEYDARQVQLQLPSTAPLTTPLSAQTPVPFAGTRVQLPNTACIAASIKALPTNAGYIYLGDNTVAAANGHVLAAGDAVNVAIDNLNRFWIDADNNGEGVSHLVVS